MTVGRLGRILRVLLVHGLALLADRLAARHPALDRRLPGRRLTGPDRLRAFFEDLGGTFIKFGQMLALQPDILPLEYCDALLTLLDRIEPFPYRDAERIFGEELGRAPEEIFDSFEREPIATASLGQVYVAWLDGRKVAVKVQRPLAEIEFASDIRLMAAATWLIRRLHVRSLYWLLAPTGEFIAWSAEELDYRNEAGYSEELRRHAATNPVQHVPAVFPALTTRRTLVVEFLEGYTLLDYLRARDQNDEVLLHRLRAIGFDRERFAANVINNFLGDAFRHGIYHADLHPANLMILEDNVVGYIDFGITGRMSRYSRHHLVLMTLALVQGDVEGMYTEYLKITSYDSTSDLPGFRAGLERLAATWYEEAGGQRRLRSKITQIFNEMLQLSRQKNVMPERDIVKYIRSAIAIDGLLARFAPAFDLGNQIGDSCSRYLRWEARRNLLSPDLLLDWSTAGSRLLLGGPARASYALARLGERERSDFDAAPPGPAGERDEEGLRARSLQLAGALFGASVLIAAGPEPARLGINLWTAVLLFAATAAVLLAGSLRRLRW
jgi:ubiquinone biosynthesis protein